MTGYNCYTNVLDTVTRLREANQNVTINMPLFAETLTYLPDMHTYTKTNNMKLMIHYNPKDFLKRESIDYIKRYYSIKRVYVFKQKFRPSKQCANIPLDSFSSKWPGINNWITEKTAK